MRHTFLFEPGIWTAEGTFSAAGSGPAPSKGVSEITHRSGLWIVDGRMRVEGPPLQEFSNRYEMAPFDPAKHVGTWSSVNSALGAMQGTIAVAGDTIISLFNSDDGVSRGVDSLAYTGEGQYESRGVLVKGSQLVSTWAMRLQRER